jgi:hypothetical protein
MQRKQARSRKKRKLRKRHAEYRKWEATEGANALGRVRLLAK